MIKKQLLGVLFYDEKNKQTKEKTGRKMAMLWITDREIPDGKGYGFSVKSKVCEADLVPALDKVPCYVTIECDWDGNIVRLEK